MTKLKILTVVIAVTLITGTTISMFVPTVCSMEAAFEYKAQSDVKKLAQIIDLYRQDYGSHPEKLDDLIGEYLHKKVKDPWGEEYNYISKGDDSIIFSYGDPSDSTLIYYVQNSKI